MTIDEAILELRVLHKHYLDRDYPKQRDALRLGIEALKRIQRDRFNVGSKHYVRLSGETE